MLREHTHSSFASVTQTLEIHGWSHLDALIIAALITESPVLLIGAHGTAKTLLVERLAYALGLDFRHYNASLLNYDDLVGIPIPEPDGAQLRFVATPSAIWDAEFVFFDEISRCRSDLQNKLFPIIHEKRVIGMGLDSLRFRWAAMNPPSPDSLDLNAVSTDYYYGSEPLDPALIDRFPLIIPVPAWKDLSRDDRRRMLLTAPLQNPVFDELPTILNDCYTRLAAVEAEHSEWLSDYIITVIDLLEKANLPQSPRRARMLRESCIAVHAARISLYGADVDFKDSAELALLYGIPQTATDHAPSPASLVAIHRQAWEISHMLEDDTWRQVLQEVDPLQRIILAEQVGIDDEGLSRLVTQALAAFPSEARAMGVATALFLHFKDSRVLLPAAWEPLARLAGRVLMPRSITQGFTGSSPEMTLWQTLSDWAITHRAETGALAQLEVNFVLAGFPDFWLRNDWQTALEQFRHDLNLFSVKEVS